MNRPTAPRHRGTPTRRRRLLQRGSVIVGVVVLLGGGSTAVWAATRTDPAAAYRTATVARGTVETRLELTGSVRQVNQASVSFPVDGTVGSVSVKVGDQVTAGQTLAALDPVALRAAVTGAAADLAKAEADLETSQTAGTSSSTSAGGAAASASSASGAAASGSTTSGSSASGGAGSGGSDAQLVAARRRVAQAKSAADQALAAATKALSAQDTVCATAVSEKSDRRATSHSSGSTQPSPTAADPSPSASPEPPASGSDELSACLAAITATQQAQKAAATAQARLSSETAALLELIGRQEKTASGSATGSSAATSTAQTSTPSAGTTTSGSRGVSTAGQIAIDTAAVESARIALATAKKNLAAATLTAPSAGTVASVGLVAGSAAGSNAIVILAPGAATVTVDLPLASIAKVARGIPADVTANGATAPVAGTVTSISLLPTSSSTAASGAASTTASSSAVTYPVVVLVPNAGGAFTSGSQAVVSLKLGTAANVLTVPNSALTRTSSGSATATVLVDGKTSRRTVKTGLTGATATEVISGLSIGDRVVLADLTAELPTNSSTSRSRLGGNAPGGPPGGGTGAPPGGGGPPGGTSGGGPG